MSTFVTNRCEDEMDAGVAFIVKKLKGELAKRGAQGIVGLGRKFKIMDVSDGIRANNEALFILPFIF